MKINTEVRGGEKLAKKLKQIQDRLTSKKRVLIGLPAGSGVYEDGAPIAVIGAVQEFGSADGRIPERSFLRVPLRQNVDNIKKGFASLSRQVTRGKFQRFRCWIRWGHVRRVIARRRLKQGLHPLTPRQRLIAKAPQRHLSIKVF